MTATLCFYIDLWNRIFYIQRSNFENSSIHRQHFSKRRLNDLRDCVEQFSGLHHKGGTFVTLCGTLVSRKRLSLNHGGWSRLIVGGKRFCSKMSNALAQSQRHIELVLLLWV